MARSFDTRWEAMLDRLVAFHGEFGHYFVPPDFDDRALAVWVRTQRGNAGANRLRSDRRARLESIGFTFGAWGALWDLSYDLLRQFHGRHGHCRVPRFAADYPGLGIWVSQQRVRSRAGKLSRQHKHRLDALGFVWDRPSDTWLRHLDELGAYFQKHGHGNVPHHSTEDRRLAQWLGQQRHRLRLGRLTQERMRDLEARGVTLEREAPWPRDLAALAEFRRQHGHCDVPENHPLYPWVHRQRLALRRGGLAPEQERELRALGLEDRLVMRHAVRLRWNRLFARLAAFKARHGHCRVTASFREPELLAFVAEQREARRKGKLLAEHQRLLDGLLFCWDPEDQSWEDNFSLLAAYRRRHGHVLGPFRLQHPKLSQWVAKVRRYHAHGKLSAARVARLEELGLEWAGQRGRSKAAGADVEQIREFRRACGHFFVPNAPPYEALYAWCEQTRREMEARSIHKRKLAALRDLGFPLSYREATWERWYAQLLSFRVRHGHLRPGRGELLAWLERQREAQRRGTLSLDREQRLERLGAFAAGAVASPARVR
ncbi:MAG: helicase associated domain-containing protein [Myxococcaceae bacterium]